MKRSRLVRFTAILMALAMLVALAGCSGGKKTETVDLSSLTMDELIAKAKEEGHVESVGMPDDWANWGESWANFTAKYGITHNDNDMSSAQELSTFEAEKDSPTRDMGDVGQAHGAVAIEMDVVQGYKPTTWDEIPDWAKDPEGRWIISYLGTMGVLVNNDLVKDDITSWQALKASDCKMTPGDVIGGASSQMSVLSAAYAFGGGLDNVQPGIDFFKEMAQAGRIDAGQLSQQRFSMGEIEVAFHWDYNLLGWRDITLEANPSMKVTPHVLTDGAIQSGYCLVFNKTAPHPHATALAIEYLLSDEGQLDRVKGYASPIRDIEIPEEIQAKRIAKDEYADAIPLTDNDALTKACEEISVLWEEEIVPLLGQ